MRIPKISRKTAFGASRKLIYSQGRAACIAAILSLLGIVPASGQIEPAEKTLMADDVFKNVQVLKGIPVNEFMETMGFFAASLGYNCTDCHVQASLANWAKYAEDIPAKRRARGMILMVNAFNKSNFGGRRVLTCYSCHRGLGIPKVIPSLAEQYGTPVDDPNEVEIIDQNAEGLSGAKAALPSFPGMDRLLIRLIWWPTATWR